jgi:hypothetical protein
VSERWQGKCSRGRRKSYQDMEDSHSSEPSETSPAEKHRTSAAVGFCPALRPRFLLRSETDERVPPSACEKIACTESIKLAWPALKHGLHELYVAVSLGKRASILAQLKQIVPQFTNTGCDQPGSVVGVVRELNEVPPLVDRSELPFEPRR